MAELLAIAVGLISVPVIIFLLVFIQKTKEQTDIVIFVLDLIDLIAGVIFLVTAFMTSGIVLGTFPILMILYVVTWYIKKERKKRR